MSLFYLEMKPLESHPLFNPAIKVTEVPKIEKKPPALAAGNDELNLNLFEQANKTPDVKRKHYTLTLTHSYDCVLKRIFKSIFTKTSQSVHPAISREDEDGAEGHP